MDVSQSFKVISGLRSKVLPFISNYQQAVISVIGLMCY